VKNNSNIGRSGTAAAAAATGTIASAAYIIALCKLKESRTPMPALA